MIPYEFAYFRPETTDEAAKIFWRLDQEGKSPLFYGGGTEILTEGRLNNVHTGAVIDVKSIPECRMLQKRGGRVEFGAGRTLAEIAEANLWPLLSSNIGRIADHTTRCKITLGGNLAGTIQYREAALPFLLVDTEAEVMGPDGIRSVPFSDLFDRQLKLEPGEFLIKLNVPEAETRLPGANRKRTRLDWVDYPLVTVTALSRDGEIRAAFSGLCSFPFRSRSMEEALNQKRPLNDRIEAAVDRIPAPVLDDVHGSAEWRKFVLKNSLAEIIEELEGS